MLEESPGAHRCQKQSTHFILERDVAMAQQMWQWLNRCAISRSMLKQWAKKFAITNHPANFLLNLQIIQEKLIWHMDCRYYHCPSSSKRHSQKILVETAPLHRTCPGHRLMGLHILTNEPLAEHADNGHWTVWHRWPSRIQHTILTGKGMPGWGRKAIFPGQWHTATNRDNEATLQRSRYKLPSLQKSLTQKPTTNCTNGHIHPEVVLTIVATRHGTRDTNQKHPRIYGRLVQGPQINGVVTVRHPFQPLYGRDLQSRYNTL